MKLNVKKAVLLFVISISIHYGSQAQLRITNVSNPQALVQQLLGQGITVSNVTVTGSPAATGFFNNSSGTRIGLDSGIVLSNGRVKTFAPTSGNWGMDGDGLTQAYNGSNPADSSSTGAFASTNLGQLGDTSLTRVLGGLGTFDATVLEFDFVPLGDSVQFRYVFASEEYPTFPCQGVNDAFGFFIRGPGISGNQNIALIPGTNFPVTIDNIQYNGACSPGAPYFPEYFISNKTNVFFTYNGHTTIFTALARVQPCQTYHLKLVVADVGDHIYDSGVFVEAKSLSSNAIAIVNTTQTDPLNNSYLVEGCSTGSFKIKRPRADAAPLTVQLSYSGSAANGVDMQMLPPSVTIAANESEVIVDVLPVIDNVPEGIETIKVYALAGCASGAPTDSTVIQIRDYDTLGISPDTTMLCTHSSVQLTASPGYSNYQWDPDPTLSNVSIRNPIASPVNSNTTYYCTATEGTCHGRDSSFISLKKLDFISKQEINCKDDATGGIQVFGGPAWIAPVQYNINNGPWQPNGSFTNLPVGVYTVKVMDASGCIDSLVIPITQLYPDLVIANSLTASATCSGAPDGSATIIVNGGKPPYSYSTDGVNFQASNVLNLRQGNYTVTVKDNNNCITTKNIVIPLFNHLVMDAGTDKIMCEGKNVQLNANSNADNFSWTPAATLDNGSIVNPVATPVVTTKYYVTGTTGICSIIDSITVFVNPAPIPNAGPDKTICYGQNITLQGSGGTNYFWTPSSYLNNSRIATPTATRPPGTITYYLNVIDGNGCPSLSRDAVTITVTRPAIVYAGRDTTLAIGQPLPLMAVDVNGLGFTQYEWTPAYGLSDAFRPDPTSILDKNMVYTITAKTALGCTATDDIKITVYKGPEIYVPGAFTPDNNGRNDVLRAIPSGIKDFHYFRIYNRWGKLLFMTNDPSRGWDGKLDGTPQAIGTYVWMAEGVDYRGNVLQRKGTVIIMK